MKRSLFVVMAGLTTDELEVINSGVGGLKYAGHPAKKDLHHSMTGGISEL
jgi:hypothetical protein